jgi:deoxyribonucleoside regulator
MLGDTDELLSVRAAEMYYDENLTQDEIGGALHLTRWKVGRLLAQARAQGIVRIEIVHPRARRVLVERALRDRFGLRDVVVVSSAGVANDAELQRRVAQGAADFLMALRPVPPTLGVSWGRTMSDVAACLPVGWARGVGVVQINGGLSLTASGSPAAATAMTIAQKAAGSAHVLPIPAILEHAETKRGIERDRAVAGVLERAAAASAYLFSAGVATENSALVISGYLTPDDVETLVGKGAVGDVVGRFIGENGRPVDKNLDARTVGLDIQSLRNASTSIAVISGEGKHPVARAVVTSGICTILVTDDRTAAFLLESHGHGQDGRETARHGADKQAAAVDSHDKPEPGTTKEE